MTNTDNKYGTFNKKTTIFSQIDDGSTALTTFATVAEAKAFFLTAEALAVYDECCTELQWALVGTTGLKCTMAFGTKGGNIAAGSDWAGEYLSRINSLMAAGRWASPWANKKSASRDTEESDSHLF